MDLSGEDLQELLGQLLPTEAGDGSSKVAH